MPLPKTEQHSITLTSILKKHRNFPDEKQRKHLTFKRHIQNIWNLGVNFWNQQINFLESAMSFWNEKIAILESGFEKMTELLHSFCNFFESCIPKCKRQMLNF